MIHKNTLNFLKHLRLNNSKEWLNDNKKRKILLKSKIFVIVSNCV